MRVMPANHRSLRLQQLALDFPDKIGHLYSPGGFSTVYPMFPFALDNGAFSAFRNGTPFDEGSFLDLCQRIKGTQIDPFWVVVPDKVGDAVETKRLWKEWAPLLRSDYRWPLAFAVQDGMIRQDVPSDADVVFIGGSTEWKGAWVPSWAAWCPRVHVARVNRPRALEYLEGLGVESCDGTGWFRGDKTQTQGLLDWVQGIRRQVWLFSTDEMAG